MTLMDTTFRAILCAARTSREPLEICLPGRRWHKVVIRTVGDSWFSANQVGGVDSELVISLNAVTMIHGGQPVTDAETPRHASIPLVAMLVQLERQHTDVVICMKELSLRGRITRVGADWVGLRKSGAEHALLPLSQFLWLEACG